MMRTLNLLLGLFLGLVIGLLSVFGALGWGLLYAVATDPKKDTGVAGPRSYKSFKPGESKEVVFDHKYDTRLEAEELLDGLIELAKSAGKVTVDDLKTATGYLPTFADRRRGWKDLSKAHITRDLYTNHFRIQFPAPEYF